MAVLVFLFATCCLVPVATMGTDNPYDEGIRLQAAENVLEGLVPYRDFYFSYGAANAYWGALLLKLYGEQVLAVRLGSVFFNGLTAVAVFCLCRSAGAGNRWSLAAVLLFLLPRTFSQNLYNCDPALTCILAAGAVIVAAALGTGRMFVAGMLIGIAALFRQDFGAYGAAALLATAFVQGLSGVQGSFGRAFRMSLVVVAGILVTAGCGFGLLAITAGLQPLFDNLIVIPSGIMPYRRTPFPWEDVRAICERIRSIVTRSPLSCARRSQHWGGFWSLSSPGRHLSSRLRPSPPRAAASTKTRLAGWQSSTWCWLVLL